MKGIPGFETGEFDVIFEEIFLGFAYRSLGFIILSSGLTLLNTIAFYCV